MPVPSWIRFGGNREQNTDNSQGEFDPTKFQEELITAHKAEIETLKAEFTSQLAPVNEMATYIKEQKAEKERILATQRQQQHNEDTAIDDELAITNPLEAMRRMNEPALKQAQAAAAITMRREILGEKEYYTGSFKEKVDSLIEAQPLSQRANPQVLNNAYKIVLADHFEEAREGKLKKQASFTNFQGTTNTKTAEQIKQEENTLSAEESTIAAKFGFTAEQWNSSKKELEYV